MTTLGLDIGGANLKAATHAGHAAAVAFPLWKSPDQLADALQKLCAALPAWERLAVTMTGELADCFTTKAEGVARILEAVETFAAGREVTVWTTSGFFVDSQTARTQWSTVAAANWQALATWSGQFAPHGFALLMDIGSTTTDLIPLCEGRPCATGRTDGERLLSGELIYTGVRRTPLCAIRNTVTWRGKPCRIAAEWFATMLDVYLILGDIVPEIADIDTADGRPATVEHARNRLAHMVCCDQTEISATELAQIATEFAEAQLQEISNTFDRLIGQRTLDTVIISGSGSFLARKIAARKSPRRIVELAHELNPGIAESACAYAVACLRDAERS